MKICLILFFYFRYVSSEGFSYVFLQIAESYVSEILDSAITETECIQQLKMYNAGIQNRELWALQMFDATAKLQPGILAGNLIPIGQYDECLEIDAIANRTKIEGQYCRTSIRVPRIVDECIHEKFANNQITTFSEIPLSEITDYLAIDWHICVPAVCTATNLQNFWDYVEDRYDLRFHVEFIEKRCDVREGQREFHLINIIAIAVFGTLAILILLSTSYDILVFQRRKDKEYNIWLAFSYFTNITRLFSLKEEQPKITCLYGIRVLTITWIILGHHYLYLMATVLFNQLYVAEWVKREENMFVNGAFAGVDTFLVISGFLIVYVILNAQEQGLQINYFVFYIHRFLRITPSVIALVLLYVGILPLFASGPYWHYVDEFIIEPCREHWWKTILLIHNYLDPINKCALQTWYLAVDTQLYWASPLLFIPLQRWPKTITCTIIALIIASAGYGIYLTYHYEIDRITIGTIGTYAERIYFATEVRMSPWLMGILLGYYMYRYKHKTFKMQKKHQCLIWLLCTLNMLFIIYTYSLTFNIEITTVKAALFNGVSRIIWGLCICWTIFACTQGLGYYVNLFLSLPFFNILSRLTYSMFITHLFIILFIHGRQRTPQYFSNLHMFHSAWGDFGFTVIFSVIWTLTFESPITLLETILLKRELLKISKREERNAQPQNQ